MSYIKIMYIKDTIWCIRKYNHNPQSQNTTRTKAPQTQNITRSIHVYNKQDGSIIPYI